MVRLIASLAAAAAFAAASPAKPVLRLDAQVEPKRALVGQPVTLKLRWTNVGKEVLRVNRRGTPGREVKLELKDSNGKAIALRQGPDAGPLRDVDFQTLGPGESYEYQYELTQFLTAALAPGRYSLRASYSHATAEGLPNAWAGTTAARELRFDVKPVR